MASLAHDLFPLLASLGSPAWIVSMRGTILCANGAAERLLGRAAGGLAGKICNDVMPPDFAVRMARARAAFTCTGLGSERLHGAFLQQDGQERFLDFTLSPLERDGAVAALLVQVHGASANLPEDSTNLQSQAAEPLRHYEILEHARETAGVGFWYFDVARRDMWADDTYYRLLGFERGEIELNSAFLRARMHPDDRERTIEAMDSLVRDATPAFHVDYRLRRKDGGYVWFAASARKFRRDHLNLPPVICGSLSDISQRKAHEERLANAKATAEMLKIAVQCGEMGAWTICAGSGEAWMLDEGYRLMGYDPGDFTPDDAGWRALIHPDDLPPAVVAMQALIEDQADVYDHEQRMRHKDGSYHWYRTVARKIDRSAEGLPPLVGGVHTCIDGQKDNERRLSEALTNAEQARQAAQARETMLRVSAQSGKVAHWTVCPELGTGWAPDETYQLLGYAAGDFPCNDAGWRSLIHPDDLAGAVEAMDKLQSGQSDVYEHEHRSRHKDGSYHWYRAVARKVDRSEEGLPYLLAGAIISIDDIKENARRMARAAEEVRIAHQRLNTLTDNSATALFEYRVSPDGAVDVPYFSAMLPEITGVPRADIEADGTAFERHVHAEDRNEVHATLEAAARSQTRVTFKHRLYHPKAGLRWVMSSVTPVAQADGSFVFYSSMLDITEQERAQQRAAEATEDLRRAHERLTSVAAIAPVGLYEYRLCPSGEADFPYTSPKFEDLLGCSHAELAELKEGILDRVAPEDRLEISSGTLVSAHDLSPWHHRFRVRHPARGRIWLSAHATPRQEADGTIIWTGAVHDVTEDVKRELELRHARNLADRMRAENERQALHDGLTGLPNRRYFDQKLAERLAAAKQEPCEATLIRIDLDHFKHVNDTLGHEAGDTVLVRVARVLGDSLDEADFAARIGGDEFSVLLAPGASEAEAHDRVTRIQAGLAEPLIYEGRQCRFGASFGVASNTELAEIGAEIQLFADAALYRAKEAGRNRLEFFTPDLHETILTERQLAVELQEALDRDEFLPYFQPQVSAHDATLSGVEALLRWDSPARGLCSPDAFMHVAEQLRIVPEIDRLMMEKSRAAMERLRRQGICIPKISFNVSSGRMHDPDVVSAARAMVENDMHVTFELLESILVEEESDAFKFHLDLLREAGIGIEIDDFGSGHASIIGLMEIAPSALKIDRRIVTPVAQDSRARDLVRAIVEIAGTLGIATVAEGVETETEARILRGLGCDVLQGYLFARPLSEADLCSYAASTGATRFA